MISAEESAMRKIRKFKPDRKSIRIRLVTAFIVTSVIPILLINIISYYNTSRLVQQNVERMTRANLEQTKVSLDVWLDSYEDILIIYTFYVFYNSMYYSIFVFIMT